MLRITTLVKTKLLFFLLLFVYLNANSIGFDTFKIYSKSRNSNIDVILFYPTNNNSSKETHILGKHKLFVSENVSLNNKIKNSKHPIILISHGGLRSAPNQINWLAKNLAQNGFIVLYTRANIDTENVLYEPWLRANDLYISYNNLKSNTKYKNSIDFTNTNFVGFLLGGTVGLVLNKAQIDFDLYKEQCNKNFSLDCNWYKKNSIDLSGFDYKKINNINFNLDLKSLTLFDIELSKVFKTNSFNKIDNHIKIINLSKDIMQLKNKHLKEKIKNSKYIQFSNSNIFSSFSLCTKKGKAILSGSTEKPNICYDNKIDRRKTHNNILNIILSK